MKPLRSYTTRPSRGESDISHTFISDDEFDNLKLADIMAYTEFDGHRYCATVQQIESSDIYAVDPDGVEFFMSHYQGEKVPIVVYFNIPEHICLARLRDRDGSLEQASKRVTHDKQKFVNVDTVLAGLNPKWQAYTITEEIDMELFAKYLMRRIRLAESYFNGKKNYHRYVLYTIDCPKCKILERKLKDKGIAYETVRDLDTMLAMGMSSAPMFSADNELMDYKAALEWLKNKE